MITQVVIDHPPMQNSVIYLMANLVIFTLLIGQCLDYLIDCHTERLGIDAELIARVNKTN